jgi:hypothetical protein
MSLNPQYWAINYELVQSGRDLKQITTRPKPRLSFAIMLIEILRVLLKETNDNLDNFMQLMLKSKGRNKIFSLIQYIVDLYVKTMTHSPVYGKQVKMDGIESVRVAKIVKKNMSSGRKVFKLLKFIDEYNSFVDLLFQDSADTENKSKTKIRPGLIRVLDLLRKLCGIFYYFFDNLVWFANMGAINKDIIENKLGWRAVKDMFALLKNFCESVKSFIKLQLSIEKTASLEKKIFEQAELQGVVIGDQDELTLRVFQLLQQRSKTTQCKLTVTTTLLRIIQLTYRLKFKFARRHIHPIFVVVCRIISIIFSLFKIWMEVQTQKCIERHGSHCIIDQKQYKS